MVLSEIQQRVWNLTLEIAQPATKRIGMMVFGLRKLALLSLSLSTAVQGLGQKHMIIDTDFFSDVDDAGALLLAATLPNVELLGVNINYPSSYSALAVSAVLNHYGHPDVPVGLRRPITNETFFDDFFYELGEYTSKVAYHWSNNSILWENLDKYLDPVDLYRKVLSKQKDRSVTIASIGFFENLSGLLNSTGDAHSSLSGVELIESKVLELVVMGGVYPSGSEYNFFGDNPLATAHVINNWPKSVPITFSGGELGGTVFSGARLTVEGSKDDPVRAAYQWYVGYNTSRESWDPLTVLYAARGLGDTFEYGNSFGYNHVLLNGSNEWVFDETRSNQKWLKLKVDNVTAGQELDELYLDGARFSCKAN